jgi:molecular chaperone DnaJ
VDSTGFHGFDNINDIFSHFSDIFGGFSGGGSIFDDFFGGGSSRRGRTQGIQGSDLKMTLKLTLEEIAEGIEKKIKVKKHKVCEECNGSGAKSDSGYASCTNCNGTGEVRQVSRSIFGQVVNVSECSNCNGEGRIVKEKCSNCSGEGRSKTETTIKVNIPPGVTDGNYIPLREQGNAGIRGGVSGDLIVFIEEEKSEYFTRHGDDVVYELDISFIDAALGADVVVPTLKGKAKLKIEQGTQSGRILKMKDKGIKHLNGYGRGDQLVKINVYTPTKLSSKEKQVLKELLKSENFHPKNNNKKKTDKSFFKAVFN